MEKYATSYEDIRPTQEQIITLKKLCEKLGKKYYEPENAAVADQLIMKYQNM